jgi:glycosyltransferase involved in cell wall biosynthesis
MQPTISIITVCYNAEKYIEQSIQSVLQQTYPHIEYIIVDGGSKDNTLSILRSYQDRISRLVSEKDEGLYDAMNKGLQLASGEYVLFLNADDQLYAPDVLEKVFNACNNADVYYGEVAFMNETGNITGLRSQHTPHKVPERLSWKSLRNGMTVSHQAFIIRRSLALPYDLQYKVCADIDWMIRCLKNCTSSCNVHLIISKFRMGGSSKQRQQLAWKERYLILQKHYGIATNFFRHLYIAIRYLLGPKY